MMHGYANRGFGARHAPRYHVRNGGATVGAFTGLAEATLFAMVAANTEKLDVTFGERTLLTIMPPGTLTLSEPATTAPTAI